MRFEIDAHVHLHLHDDEQGLRKRLDEIAVSVVQLREDIMASMQQVLDDLDQVLTQGGNYIAGRDAIDVALKQEIADLVGQNAAVAGQVDQAFAKAEQAKAMLVVPTPPAPPAVEPAPPVAEPAPPVDSAPPADAP